MPDDGAPGIEPLPPLGGVPEGGPTDCIAERTFASEMPSSLASAAAMSCGLDDQPDDGRVAEDGGMGLRIGGEPRRDRLR